MNVIKDFADNINNAEAMKSLEEIIKLYDGIFSIKINENTIARTAIIFQDEGEFGLTTIYYGIIHSKLNDKLNNLLKKELTTKDKEEIIDMYKEKFNIKITDATKTNVVEILFENIISNQILPPKKIYEINNSDKVKRISKEEYNILLKTSSNNTKYHLMYGMFDFDFEYEGPILKYVKEQQHG